MEDFAFLFRELLGRIKPIDLQVETPWKTFPAEAAIPEEDFLAYMQYRVLENASWFEAKEKIEILIEGLASLDVNKVVTFNILADIKTCYEHYAAYVTALETFLLSVKEDIQALYREKTADLDDINKTIDTLSKAINADLIETQRFICEKLSDLTKKGRGDDVKEPAKKVIEHMGATYIDNVSNIINASKAPIQQKQVRQKQYYDNLYTKVNDYFNAVDVKRTYYNPFSREVSALYINLKKQVSPYLGRLKTPKVDNINIFDALNAVYRIKKKQKISQKGLFQRVLWWVCIILLLAGVTCLSYYAYEAHIQALHLGIALGFISLSFIGMYVNYLYEGKCSVVFVQSMPGPSKSLKGPTLGMLNTVYDPGVSSYSMDELSP